MTKIDFYIAGEDMANEAAGIKSHQHVACRIIEKAYRKNLSVYVHTDSEQEATEVDELLWTFRTNSFVPHSMDNSTVDSKQPLTTSTSATDAVSTPEVLISSSNHPRHHADVLVNLSSKTPEFYSRFLRLAEIVSADEKAKSLSRERYKYYRDRGYPLNVHQL